MEQNKLPKIVSDTNNIICYEFLKKKDPYIFKVPFDTQKDKNNVLNLLFTEVIYNHIIDQIMNGCNQIMPFHKEYSNHIDQIMDICNQILPFHKNGIHFFYTYDYFFQLLNRLFFYGIQYSPNKILRDYTDIKKRQDFVFILDAVKGDLFEEQNKKFYLLQISLILDKLVRDQMLKQQIFQINRAKDPICIYLSSINKIDYYDSIDSIFNENAFQELVRHFLAIPSIPGLIKPKNEFDILKNNLITLKFLLQNNLVQQGQKAKTTEDRFNLLKSLILEFYPVEENSIFEIYNYHMPDELHIKDVNFLYSPYCFFRYYRRAFYDEDFMKYDGISLLNFDQTIEDEIEKQQYSCIIFLRSCFYKDEKYRFLILIQYGFLTHFIENKPDYMNNDTDYHNVSESDNGGNTNEQEIEEENQQFEKEERHRMRNEERKNSNKIVLHFNDKMLYNAHAVDQESYFCSDNPFFHYKRKGIHTTKYRKRHIITRSNSTINIYGLNETNKKDENKHESSFDSDEFDYSSDDDRIDNNDNENSFHDITNNMLLKTINALCENSGLHFDDFYQTAKNDSIPKFVMTILNLKEIKKVNIKDKKKKHHKSKKLSESEIENIKAVIRYLQSKEPRFLTLVFDFTKENLIESSSILFYSKFLNLFFLKETKEKLLKRCIKILSIEEVNKNKILTDFDTYYSLVYYVQHGKVKKNIYKRDQHKEKTFKKAKIPCLINKEFLQLCRSKNELPDVLFYQLQLIFNALDAKQPPPPTSTTTTTEDAPNNFYKNEIEYPLTFRERLELYKVSLKNDNSNRNAKFTNINVLSEEKYWSSTDKKCLVDDGVIVYTEESQKMKNEWENSIKKKEEIATKAKESKFKLKKKKKLFNDNEFKTKDKIKPFKLFVYNEKNAKWCFNKEEFSAFCKNSSLDSNEMPTPLILYMNSFEKDLIAINSNFINHPYPDLKDETNQIYVYAFCDRNLSLLSYQVDPEENSKTKPIFLLLHVPESKKNHPDISKIVLQIYSFLSYICDIEIFVLNKNHYKDQAEFIMNINKIFTKNDELSSRRKSSNFSKNFDDDQDSSESFNEEIADEEDEDDNNDESKENQSSDDDDSDDKLADKNGDDFIEFKIYPKIPIKSSKIIVLANDPDVHGDVDEYDTFFFNSLLYGIKFEKEKKGLFKFHLININEAVTYRQFLESLKDFSIKSDTVFGEILQRFKLVPMSDISNAFIQIKTKKSWQEKLKELIFNRYLMYEKKSIEPSIIISHVMNELTKIASHYDLEFYNECSSTFLDIKKKHDKNREIITNELRKSSFKHISDMKQINDYELFTKRTNDNLQKSHINFLRKEYFDIVKFISQSKDFCSYYENNLDILDYFIKNGIDEIIKLRKEVKGFFKRKLDPKDEDDYINGSTNYEIRQKENVKEMKIQISLEGDLTDEIDQDF